jgi:hypothetical protein
MEVVGIATLLYDSIIPKEVRIDLAWSCFDASYCPCKAVRSGSRSYYSSLLYMQLSVTTAFPLGVVGFATLL